MLIFQRNLVETENQCPDKYIVNTQTFLNEITTDVFARRCSTKSNCNHSGERDSYRYPDGTFNEGFTWTDIVSIAVNDQNVNRQQNANEGQ